MYFFWGRMTEHCGVFQKEIKSLFQIHPSDFWISDLFFSWRPLSKGCSGSRSELLLNRVRWNFSGFKHANVGRLTPRPLSLPCWANRMMNHVWPSAGGHSSSEKGDEVSNLICFFYCVTKLSSPEKWQQRPASNLKTTHVSPTSKHLFAVVWQTER